MPEIVAHWKRKEMMERKRKREEKGREREAESVRV